MPELAGRSFGPPGVGIERNGNGSALTHDAQEAHSSSAERTANKQQTNNAVMLISQQEALARQAGTCSQCLKRDNQMV
jgi:hypothetical protein